MPDNLATCPESCHLVATEAGTYISVAFSKAPIRVDKAGLGRYGALTIARASFTNNFLLYLV